MQFCVRMSGCGSWERTEGRARGLQSARRCAQLCPGRAVTTFPPHDTYWWHPQAVPTAWARKGVPRGGDLCPQPSSPSSGSTCFQQLRTHRNQQSETLAPGEGSPFSTKKLLCAKALPANQKPEGCFAAFLVGHLPGITASPSSVAPLSPSHFPPKTRTPSHGGLGLVHGPQEREYTEWTGREAFVCRNPPGTDAIPEGEDPPGRLAPRERIGGQCRRGSQAGKRREGLQTQA